MIELFIHRLYVLVTNLWVMEVSWSLSQQSLGDGRVICF